MANKDFEGKIIIHNEDIPRDWDEKVRGSIGLSREILNAALSSDTPYNLFYHEKYCLCENRSRLNILTFGKAQLWIRLRVISSPISMDDEGYCGDIMALLNDFRARKGLFLMLNLKSLNNIDEKILKKFPWGKTLPTAIFKNRFTDFEDYIQSLRSPYRRRVKLALERGRELEWERIAPLDFDDRLYELYVNVLENSDYPLERLGKEFFQNSGGEIYRLYPKGKENSKESSLGFIMIKENGDELKFIFGGMDYSQRDKYDIYYNMLLKILKIGIERSYKTINLGQTAESSKCRLGCVLEDRYMLFFSSNKIVSSLMKVFSKLLEYQAPTDIYNVFREDDMQ